MKKKRKKSKKKVVKKKSNSKKIVDKKSDKDRIRLLQNIVVAISGPNSEKIIDLLYNRDNVNEFIIAKKLKITINQARNILYKLTDEGIVGFTRKKDKKSGGWYTYFWTLDIEKSLTILRNRIINNIKNLEYLLKSKEMKRFYFCSNCDIEVSEENALLYNFTCPECGEVFELKNNKNEIEHFKNEIERLKNELLIIDGELEKIYKKDDLLKQRRLKAEEKKKKKERNEKREERERLRKKEDKKKMKPKKKGKKKKVVKKKFRKTMRKTTKKKIKVRKM